MKSAWAALRACRRAIRCTGPATVLAAISAFAPVNGYAAAGTEAAAFLNIPVGGAPAALGGAYSALATDAYAPVWNPAGLGFLDSIQLSGQHLAYLESIHYEYLSFVYPFGRQRSCPGGLSCGGSAIGVSGQYLGSGDIEATNRFGQSIGQFSSHYGAYAISFGRAVTSRLSLGLTGKIIEAMLSDVSAHAYAGDAGALFRISDRLMLAGTLTNAGSQMKFLREGGDLPLAGRLGLAFQPIRPLQLSVEGAYRRAGLASAHFGAGWRPVPAIAIRAGYRTDTSRQLDSMAGLSAGLGLQVWGHQLDYAWLPYGDLGQTHYLSMTLRFGGEVSQERRDLIRYKQLKRHRVADSRWSQERDPEYGQLMQLLADYDPALAVKPDNALGGRP